MNEPTYHLSHVVKSKNAEPEDFSGPLDVILLLLSKNKIEIRDIQISVILEQYLAYLDEMKRMVDAFIGAGFWYFDTAYSSSRPRCCSARPSSRRASARWSC